MGFHRVSTNAILAQVFVGTHSCPYMVWDREDCVGVYPRRPNWAASHAHMLMHGGGNVCKLGGHFFTFADDYSASSSATTSTRSLFNRIYPPPVRCAGKRAAPSEPFTVPHLSANHVSSVFSAC